MTDDDALEEVWFTGGPLDGDCGPVDPAAVRFPFRSIVLMPTDPPMVRRMQYDYERIAGSREFVYVGNQLI
jgi:hypothetical protein